MSFSFYNCESLDWHGWCAKKYQKALFGLPTRGMHKYKAHSMFIALETVPRPESDCVPPRLPQHLQGRCSLPQGWSDGTMVLGKLRVPGRPTYLEWSRARSYYACSRCGWGLLDIFFLVYYFSFLSPSLSETARYRLKYCLKGPLSPKTNQVLPRFTNDRQTLFVLVSSQICQLHLPIFLAMMP